MVESFTLSFTSLVEIVEAAIMLRIWGRAFLKPFQEPLVVGS